MLLSHSQHVPSASGHSPAWREPNSLAINAKINQASALALSRANSSAVMVPASSKALASLI